jgi:hypothetical protein
MFSHSCFSYALLFIWGPPMRRRDFLLVTIAGIGAPWAPSAFAQDGQAGRGLGYWKPAMQDFPFELVEISGRDALTTWEQLKREGRGEPVVVGGAKDVALLSDPFEGRDDRDSKAGIDAAIARSNALKFPLDLREMRRKEHEAACADLAEMKRSGAI